MNSRRPSNTDPAPTDLPGPATEAGSADETAAEIVSALASGHSSDLGGGSIERLRADLATRAQREGLLDIGYRSVDSPFGPLLVAVTEQGVVRIAFEREDHERVLDDLSRAVSPRVLRSSARTDAAARQLEEYLDGARRRFDLSVDLRLLDGFRREVVARLADIGYGRTTSYAGLAAAAGNPRAARAVGSACSHNPIPIVLPCHRVVRADGAIGQYLGGVEVKQALLAMEAAQVAQ